MAHSLRASKRLIAIGFLLTTLTACAGSGSSTSCDSAKDVAAAIGCTGYKSASPELYAADAASCKHQGHYTTVEWFKSGDKLTSLLKVAGAFGGSSVHGSNWVVECDTRPDCEAIQAKSGGTLS